MQIQSGRTAPLKCRLRPSFTLGQQNVSTKANRLLDRNESNPHTQLPPPRILISKSKLKATESTPVLEFLNYIWGARNRVGIGNGSLEWILGLLKSLKIRTQLCWAIYSIAKAHGASGPTVLDDRPNKAGPGYGIVSQ
jgi:hypothetical protein